MKNSLFKRAIATAAAVPLALTQCLTYASAVSTDMIEAPAAVQAENDALTLESLLYIPADQTVSKWNMTVSNSLAAVQNRTGDLDITPYVEDIAGKAGAYSDAVKVILTKYIIPNGVTYEITGSNDIILKGKVTSPKQYDAYKGTPGEALKNVGDKYGVPGLINQVTFEDVDVSGEITVTIKASKLDTSTTVPVSVEFKTADGSYGIGQIPAWAKGKVLEIQAVAEKAIKEKVAADKVDAAIADYEAQIKKITDKLDKADAKIDSALKYSQSGDYANVAAIIAEANAKLAEKNFKKQIPATATDIATNATVAKAYDQALKIAAPNGEIAITAAELGAFADSIKDITASLAGGVGTGTGTFDDAEKDAVIAYYADGSKGFTVKDSYKQIKATVDFSGIKSVDAGSVDVQIERVLVTETTTTTPTTTTSTTTTTTTSTDTTTTSTDTTTTSTETTTSTDTTTTSTETTSTDTTSTSTDTTTTSTTSMPADVTVTTSVVKSYVTADTDYAFYLNTEEEFDKAQVSNVILHTSYVEGYTIDGQTIITKEGEDIKDITADINFGSATPSNTYKQDNTTFKYSVPVYGADGVLTDNEGKNLTVTVYIGVKGDTNLDSVANAVDASQVLAFYAKTSTQGRAVYDVILSESKLVSTPDGLYEEFAAFLSDVHHDASVTVGRDAKKDSRSITANDASNILAYYSKRSADAYKDKTDKEIWDEVLSK